MIFGSNAPNNGLLSLPSLGIGPSSFSHIENNGSKDPTVSFSLEYFKGSPSILLSLLGLGPYGLCWCLFGPCSQAFLERARQQNIERVKYTKERKAQGFGCEFHLSPTMAIETYWSKCLKGVWGFFQLVVWKISLWWI